jgi:hypothetical protein
VRLNLEVGRLESRDSTLFAGIELRRAGAARAARLVWTLFHGALFAWRERIDAINIFTLYFYGCVQTISIGIFTTLGLSLGIVIRIDVSL